MDQPLRSGRHRRAARPPEVGRLLRTLGCRRRRPQLARPSAPEAAPKLGRLAEVLLTAPADAVTLALGEFLAFLAPLEQAYPARPLDLVLDNASIHTAKLTRAWLAEHAQVTLCVLPAYAGRRENPVEQVWWRMKQQGTANRLYGDLDRLVAAADAFFGGFTPSAALALAA